MSASQYIWKMYTLRMLSPVLFIIIMNTAGCSDNQPSSPVSTVADTTETETAGAAPLFTDLTQTTDIRKLLCQNWEHKEDAEDAAAGGGEGEIEQPYRGIAFFDDGSVTQNPRDKMRLGKWTFDEGKKLIHLDLANGPRVTYKMGAIGATELVLQQLTGKTNTIYRSDAKFSPDPTLNPFYPANNQWRVKPARKESAIEIKTRSLGALDFYAKFLTDNAAREGNIISFVGLPGCFKWYNGGISISSENKLGEKWISCFYNREQALQGRQLLEDIISKKYKWNKKETNWVKQSADILRQMKDTLQRL